MYEPQQQQQQVPWLEQNLVLFQQNQTGTAGEIQTSAAGQCEVLSRKMIRECVTSDSISLNLSGAGYNDDNH